MHFESKAVVKAPVDKLWNFISTPEWIPQCLPGVEEGPVNRRAKLLVDGSGVTSAFKAEIQINCNPHPEGTELSWVADATVSGPLGSVAKGLLENASQKIISQTLE